MSSSRPFMSSMRAVAVAIKVVQARRRRARRFAILWGIEQPSERLFYAEALAKEERIDSTGS